MARAPFFIALTVLAGLVLGLSPASAMGSKRFHDGETQRGLASWCGLDQQGKPTANGEIFDMRQLTAAHRYLPFGTIVRVTNRSNGVSVEVRINDRGPWGDGGWIIDVSSAAADALRMKSAGTIPVEIEVIHLGSPGRDNQGSS